MVHVVSGVLIFFIFSLENTIATKLICYTRSNSSIHQLPATYPRSALSTPEEFEKAEQLVEKLIYEKVWHKPCVTINE